MFDRILVATDGSALSNRAVATAIRLATHSHAEIVALTVIPLTAMDYSDGAMMFASEELADAERRSAGAAQRALDAIRVQAEAGGVRFKGATVISDMVADAIIATAREHHSDLIVMASHGRTGLVQLLLGSETQHVLQHSKLPVLVVR